MSISGRAGHTDEHTHDVNNAASPVRTFVCDVDRAISPCRHSRHRECLVYLNFSQSSKALQSTAIRNSDEAPPKLKLIRLNLADFLQLHRVATTPSAPSVRSGFPYLHIVCFFSPITIYLLPSQWDKLFIESTRIEVQPLEFVRGLSDRPYDADEPAGLVGGSCSGQIRNSPPRRCLGWNVQSRGWNEDVAQGGGEKRRRSSVIFLPEWLPEGGS